jgi:hypothetical protein
MAKQNNDNGLSEIDSLIKTYTKEAIINPDFVEATAGKPDNNDQKVETRGRKKGSKFKTDPPPADAPQTVTNGSLISGAILLLFIDLAIPNILCWSYNAFQKNKKKKINPRIMQLSQKQKDELEPLANEASKQLLLQASPLTVFLVALCGIYGLNFMMLTGANNE